MAGSRDFFWRLVDLLQTLDYDWLLPLAARLPMPLGYRLAAWRGLFNARLGRDWRSVALRTRHVARNSSQALRELLPAADEQQLAGLLKERFVTDGREEFEGCLIAAGRAAGLRHAVVPAGFAAACRERARGLVLLTPHYDSFTLGIVLLGLAGARINAMSSAITADPRVAPGVSRHFTRKYRGMEKMMNGGRILDQESGLKPFYRMLNNGECLVIIADLPPGAHGAELETPFLGARRRLAGGALRLAVKTGSDIGAFVCRYQAGAGYLVQGSPIVPSTDPGAVDQVYGFLSREIMASPGRWLAADMLPRMPRVDDKQGARDG